MVLDVRYANHPDDVKGYDTQKLREHFLIESLFVENEVCFTYSHVDRIMVGGIMPVSGSLTLEAGKEMGVEFFMQRREVGVINIGGSGVLTLDGEEYEVNHHEGAYIGMGIKDVTFRSVDPLNPAKFYLNSAPAHKSYPTTIITLDKAAKVELGDPSTLNVRTINQFVHPSVCESCQLVMGLTTLAPGSVWNTMPCHTHERRMEVYLYFNMEPETRVFHYMGKPDETRHLVMANEQAVISPSWSIHSGVGTNRYSFIWGMCGENQTFDDMDFVDVKEMK